MVNRSRNDTFRRAAGSDLEASAHCKGLARSGLTVSENGGIEAFETPTKRERVKEWKVRGRKNKVEDINGKV